MSERCETPNCHQDGTPFTVTSPEIGNYRVVLCGRHDRPLRVLQAMSSNDGSAPPRRARVDDDYLDSLVDRDE